MLTIKGKLDQPPPFEGKEPPVIARHPRDGKWHFLNLELGIMHQDITPRNIFIDPDTQGTRLVDFDWAAQGKVGLRGRRDDVTGVIYTLYEIITGNNEYTGIHYWERDDKEVQNLLEWPVRRELDRDVSAFPQFTERMRGEAQIRGRHRPLSERASALRMARYAGS
ncbi:uncharacterized protein BP5553_04469 [Venustampulla echinocandica]|uniref:non-specific serine/threonine protein kinase n=1 Tax=Venustampulla echinocandica TaxID=2656787 RepID=A0A370TND6_9HELO|nr:uncharacterized protein BP5553_04469 [Venustampulla echinocandica]RDL37036.1 hypothetical protein BP5553_04469 [Venustampulla echinocandica]